MTGVTSGNSSGISYVQDASISGNVKSDAVGRAATSTLRTL
nr:MAG TPA: hypothetical protein [Caudoviricetes sp.]